MGWAKYLEDNLSIINNRLELNSIGPNKCERTVISYKVAQYYKKPINPTSVGNKRTGIKILFSSPVGHSLAGKLQMNGWWFSKVNNCWCNYNTLNNRQYANRLAVTQAIKIILVA